MGFSQKGREYLKTLQKKREEEDTKESTKIITGLKNIQKILSEEERFYLELNERAGRIYNIVNRYEARSIPMIFQEEER